MDNRLRDLHGYWDYRRLLAVRMRSLLMVTPLTWSVAQILCAGTEPPTAATGGVTADDTDAVLMKWRLDKRYIRQVYGDLSVETVQDR